MTRTELELWAEMPNLIHHEDYVDVVAADPYGAAETIAELATELLRVRAVAEALRVGVDATLRTIGAP